MLTFSDLRSRVVRLLDEATNTQTSTTNLVNDALNASHRRVCLMRPWPFMRWPQDGTFTTVANQRSYPLNSSVGRLASVWDATAEDWLPLIPLRNWEAAQVNRTSTLVERPGAIFGGYSPVAAQPAASGAVLGVKSSSASDSSTKTVVVRGIDSTGEVITETFTMNGMTEVTGSSTFYKILNVTKTGTWVGTLTLGTGAFLTTVYLTLLAAQYGKQYPTLEFIESPAAGRVFTYSFSRNPQTLSLDNDIPEVPFPYSEILAYDTLIDFGAYNTEIDQKHLTIWQNRYEEILKQLEESQDQAIVGSQPRYVRDVEGPRGHAAAWRTA